ncbi:MAG: CehA/McbA family metallohydrolase [Synergistaceae bacterium]|jgi:hypothetical protein|nr:CehA/McbA family metallohydrolase [Synergistaceae bacterium]
MKTNFLRRGNFYKGNIHTHTTRSDGRHSPEDVVREYRERGYDFLAITDHNIYTDFRNFDGDDFLLLPGMEINAPPQDGNDTEYHFLALPGTREMRMRASLPPYEHDFTLQLKPLHTVEYLQPIIDDATRRGCWITLNHPYWSRVEYDQVLAFKNISALEVYNFCSSVLENTGESFQCWDAVLRNGARMLGTSVDDAHHFFPENSGGYDAFGGYVVVKADSLSLDDITLALVSGSFYGSAGGPEIHEFYVDDGYIHFHCSPAARIYFGGRARHMRWKIADPGGTLLTEFVSPLQGDELYVRAECFGESGGKSFTNPIWLDALDI